jgi:isoleucyl-tRNA synthetase
MEQDKINAYMTLYTALVTLCKIAAPMIPFMTEDIYRNLVCSIDKNAPESIHLCDFPKVNEAMIDKNLEASMSEVLDVVVLGRACRNSANIKNRQPIAKMFVKAELALANEYSEIIEDELNVKDVIYTDDVSAFTSYSFKPQLRTLGKKLGKNLGKLRELLPTIDGNAAMAELNETGLLKIDLGEVVAELTKEDLLISAAQMPGFESLSDHGVTVVLDTNLTPELIEEGNIREIVSKIQTMRKDADFEVLDKIRVYVLASDAMRALMEKNASDIMPKTLCTEFIFGETCDTSKEWSIGDEKMTLGVEKV